MDNWMEIRREDGEPDGSAFARVTVAPDSPFLSGHFPGQPVVPGIAMLGMVQALLNGQSSESRISIFGCSRVRFRKLVEGGGEFTVSVRPQATPEPVSFDLRAGGEPCSSGILATSSSVLKPQARPEFEAADLPKIEELIPHRPPMLLVDQLLTARTGECISATTVASDWPLLSTAGASSICLIEVAAQTAAALMGWEGNQGAGSSGRGYLVGVKKAAWSRPGLEPGTSLLTRVERLVLKDDYAVFSATIFDESRLVATIHLQAMLASGR